MKISKIEIANVIGLHRADIEIKTPVLMVLGANEAGKSSLRDAISLAILGDASRIKIKNKGELAQLMHGDAKKARVTLLTGDDLLAQYTLPKGEHEVSAIDGAAFLPHVINPSLTASLDDKALRSFLYSLTRCKVSPEVVAQKLLARGAIEKLVEEVKPMLRAGFPSAQKDAAENATKAKGAFRALTGDNWGSEQSEGWEMVIPDAPDMPDVSPAAIDAAIADYDAMAAEVEKGVKFIAALEEKVKAANSYEERRSGLSEEYGKLKREQTKLETDQETLEELENALSLAESKLKEMQAGAVPVACPCCAELLRITGQKLEKFEGLKADTKATTDLALDVTKSKNAVDMLKRAIVNDQEAVTLAKKAGDDLAALEAEGAPVIKPNLLETATGKLDECRVKQSQLRAKVEAVKQRQEAIASADDVTARAQGHHTDVLAWLLISDALKPDGIPSEILESALKPVNDSLAILSRMSGWKKVAISKDMEITADGRIYGLMSESAKWRIDTLLAAMISQISELKFLMLDRFDVLDQTGRGQLLNLALDLVEMNLIDQIIICGTLKAPMPAMDDQISQVWIDNGQAANV